MIRSITIRSINPFFFFSFHIELEEEQMEEIEDVCGVVGAEAETKIMHKGAEFSAASVNEQSIPEPIHKDEISILGQTHAKSSSTEENLSSSSSSSIIVSTSSVFISAFIIAFSLIQ